MKNQVVSLEIARELNEKLKSVGRSVESEFYWYRGRRTKYNKWKEWSLLEAFHYRLRSKFRNNHKGDNLDQYIPTYTLHEMLEMLPDNIEYESDNYIWDISPNEITYIPYENNVINLLCIGEFHDENNPIEDAAAKLMIWLVDNGYVKGGKG